MIKKIFQFFWKRKLLLIILIFVLVGSGYYLYNKSKNSKSTVSYVVAKVEKGSVIPSVSGTGQVSALSEIDLKPEVSGKLIYANLINGQKVKKGEVLARIDSGDAQKNVRDAKTSLETAKLSLEKLTTVDEFSLEQAQNSLDQAKEAKLQAQEDLENSYEDAYNSISSAFLKLPDIITGVDNILYSYDIAKDEPSINNDQENKDVLIASFIGVMDEKYIDDLRRILDVAETDYDSARGKYDSNYKNYRNLDRHSEKDVIETVLSETLETTRSINRSAKSENNLLSSWMDYRDMINLDTFQKITTYKSNLSSYISESNSLITSLLSTQNDIKSAKTAITNADWTIKEKTETLKELKEGADELDIRSQNLSILQKQDALSDAIEELSKYTIKAPFDGSTASVSVQNGDSVSSANTLAVIITDQRIAEISLNEVDVANIKLGQKVTLTFDAVEDLNITGEVVEVDSIGTVSQGVVSYNVKIAFDVQDERIKPGMSVSASIIVDSKQGVVVVPNSAIKTKNNISYVEVPDEEVDINKSTTVSLTNGLKQQTVEIGLADDNSTEIIFGLNEGDIIITKTITSSGSAKNSSNTNSSTNSTKSILSGSAGRPPEGMMR